ncbi:MAG TPA: hydrogenase expression/formation protein HypE [Nitrosomonas sp.]|nr:hydrogenase expression/formation protein HypE [Nitrosomonas sp.]
MSQTSFEDMACPLTITTHPRVLMAHGGGGRLMNQLIDAMFRAIFTEVQSHDGAVVASPQDKLVMTTDSFVVRPLFFPGGDIGMMAVNGTINDLAMCGARPLYLSVAFILEEGLEMTVLWRVIQSMHQAADAAGVKIVTGDTKVVERGHGDGIYINTTGIGALQREQVINPSQVQLSDAVLISGDIGRHGMAVLMQRENLSFSSPIASDCAPLTRPVMALLEAGIAVHCLRDPTRGGLAAVLNEVAAVSGFQIDCSETAIPVDSTVQNLCELLGFDPLQVANEGRFVCFVAAKDAPPALEILQRFDPRAAQIGTVVNGRSGLVSLQTAIGGSRILDMPSGELLPRIC